MITSRFPHWSSVSVFTVGPRSVRSEMIEVMSVARLQQWANYSAAIFCPAAQKQYGGAEVGSWNHLELCLMRHCIQ